MTRWSEAGDRPVIELCEVTRRFHERVALDRVSLEVRRGCVFGLIGENGAGKTTLIRHVLGLLRAQSGSVRVFGLDPVEHPVSVLGRIGFLSEERDLPDWMRVSELMRYTQAFFPGWDAAYAEELRETFDLDPKARVRSLSRGQRARAGLLVALAYRPDLLVLDEPSSGLDPLVRRDILGAIVRTIADEGRTVLFSSHLLDEVERVADDVALIHRGRVLVRSSVEELKESHWRLTLQFGEPCEQPPQLSGTLSCVGRGTQWTYVCHREGGEVRREAEALGARIVDQSALSLDEIFVSRVLA
ncbi:MAG: ABC transporter ATP-binding protein [Pirellulaceae bacterium]